MPGAQENAPPADGDAEINTGEKLRIGELHALRQAYESRVAAGEKCGPDWLLEQFPAKAHTRSRAQALLPKFAA